MTRTANVLDKLVDAVVSSGGEKLENVVTHELIWTNPNPTASFSAQSISVPCSDYDFIEILATGISANTQFNIFRATTDGTNNWMLFQTNDNQGATNVNGFRIYGVHSTYVQFLDAYFNNAMNNNYLVPQKVWGIKKVTALDKGTILADYVVERGTDGNWRYEKWNSGKYEIWYRGELSLAFNTLVATPIYSTAQQTIYYPETMAGVHYAEVNFQANTPHCLGAYISVTAVDRVQFFAKANIQSTFGGYVHIHVIGRWK